MNLSRHDIVEHLKSKDGEANNRLFALADDVRKKYVGDEIHLRGLVEFSNICKRQCTYCGINCNISNLTRYIMSVDEIVETAGNVVEAGFGTIVLQSGDGALNPDIITQIILSIKKKYNLAITLSVGEHSMETFKKWRDAGGDRYLLKMETGLRELYRKIHPDSPFEARIEMLKNLKKLGFEIGSGVMVGIPGQTYESIADDLLLMKELDIDMVGTGPFIPHPDTKLGHEFLEGKNLFIPNTMEMALKVVALTRILLPDINIPSTTAIATVNLKGRTSALNAGANVIMPNMTPAKYRKLYQIYPSKNPEFSDESPEIIRNRVSKYLVNINRKAGEGKGFRPKSQAHQ